MEDFPTFFVTEHAHWLDLRNGEVEFRPLGRLWDQSSESQNWRLLFLLDRPKMIHGKSTTSTTRRLIDIRSGTFKDIAARIDSLENAKYLTMVYDVQMLQVSIELPRFRLSFFVNAIGELESKNMEGMVIDNNQCTGTMIGLSSRLVLRNKDSIFASLPRSRCVLIPHGHVHFNFSPDRNHVRVRVDIDTPRRQVTWYKYEIDSDLGLLVGTVNLTSRLYRIYLHALCSHPLPDPLMSQTGTDHALHELRAAGSFSFQRLTEADVELLRLIGNLTPLRSYYPTHLRVMQNIKWSADLPALSQHGGFDVAVRKILQYAQSLTIFDVKDRKAKCGGDSYLMERATQKTSDSFLMERATRRNGVYYEGGVKRSPESDRRYDSRDSPHVTDYDSEGIEALTTSRLVYAWPTDLTRRFEASELLETFREWGDLRGPIPDASLIYTREWLDSDDSPLKVKWLSIYDLCRAGPSNKFELVFSFAALAYHSNMRLRNFIPTLLAVAAIPRSNISLPSPPPHSAYNLADGFQPLRGRVQSMIASRKYNLADSPAGRLSQRSNESSSDFRFRQSSQYDENISQRKINPAADYFMNQWPCSTPSFPFHQMNDSWFDTKTIKKEIEAYFLSCSHNAELRSFISDVATKLNARYKSLPSVQIPRFCFVPQFDVRSDGTDCPFILENLLSSRTDSAPQPSSHEFRRRVFINPTGFGQPIDTSGLEKLISQFQHNSLSTLASLYSERLESSRRELCGQQKSIFSEDLPSMKECLEYRDQCRDRLDHWFCSIFSALAPSSSNPAELILNAGGLWPRIHRRSILQALASTANMTFTPQWNRSLTTFAEMFIEYQKSQRLVAYAFRSEVDNFFKEAINLPVVESNPDWLLIQVR